LRDVFDRDTSDASASLMGRSKASASPKTASQSVTPVEHKRKTGASKSLLSWAKRRLLSDH
jgi:hypothetical protein